MQTRTPQSKRRLWSHRATIAATTRPPMVTLGAHKVVDNGSSKKKENEIMKQTKPKEPSEAVERHQGGVNNLNTPTGCGLRFLKFRMQLRILFGLECQKGKRMAKFGIDYTTMMMEATVYKCRCLR